MAFPGYYSLAQEGHCHAKPSVPIIKELPSEHSRHSHQNKPVHCCTEGISYGIHTQMTGQRYFGAWGAKTQLTLYTVLRVSYDSQFISSNRFSSLWHVIKFTHTQGQFWTQIHAHMCWNHILLPWVQIWHAYISKYHSATFRLTRALTWHPEQRTLKEWQVMEECMLQRLVHLTQNAKEG